MKDFLESGSWLRSLLWCFSFFPPVVKNNAEDKFTGLSSPAEGFQVGLPLPTQGIREVLEAGLLETWDSLGRAALGGVTYSSMLTVSGLAVWRSILATIFLCQPHAENSGYFPFLISVPLFRWQTCNITLWLVAFSSLWLSSSLPLNDVFYMFIIFEINWILRSYSGFIFNAKSKCPEPCKGQAFT